MFSSAETSGDDWPHKLTRALLQNLRTYTLQITGEHVYMVHYAAICL